MTSQMYLNYACPCFCPLTDVLLWFTT